jgi:hypothetical protein
MSMILFRLFWCFTVVAGAVLGFGIARKIYTR